jgi:hypothetical protein
MPAGDLSNCYDEESVRNYGSCCSDLEVARDYGSCSS